MTTATIRPAQVERQRIVLETLYRCFALEERSRWYYLTAAIQKAVENVLTSVCFRDDRPTVGEEFDSETRNYVVAYMLRYVLTPAEATDWMKRADNWAGTLLRHRLTWKREEHGTAEHSDSGSAVLETE